MDTTTAATQASVTVATIRTWCRIGAVAAAKVAGRWVIEAASLAHRISLGRKRNRMDDIQPIDRGTFEARAIELGITHPMKDARCHGEYLGFKATGKYYSDTPYNRLMVARGKALDEQDYTAPARRPAAAGTGFAHREMQALTGLPSTGGNECHYCGLDPRTCDCR